jgi:hypothetical protein
LRHVRILGLCLLAAFAFGAVAAVTASAEGGPEGGTPGYDKCVKATKVGKTYVGEYSEKECKTKASPAKTGKYELEAVDSGKFEAKSKSTTLTTHTTKGVAVTVVCKKDKVRGEIVSENEVSIETITFEDCLVNGEKSKPCGNVGPETIETAPQEALLVWLDKEKTEAGVLLIGERFAAFKCGAEEVVVDGGVEGTVTLGGKKGPTIDFSLNGSKEQAEKTFYLGGVGVLGPFNLYTEPNPGEEVESTLQGEEAQKGPSGVY